MRTPDRGSTTGAASWTDRERSKRAAPTKTPGAFLNNACVGPEGARPMDGPSNGEQSESIPPSPPYSRLKLVRKYGLFFACGTAALPGVGINASPGLPIPKAAPPASSPARRSAAGNPTAAPPVARPGAASPGTPQAAPPACSPSRRSAAGEKEPKLILFHALILLAEIIHQRSDGR